MPSFLAPAFKRLGKLGTFFAALLVLFLIAMFGGANNALTGLISVPLLITGVWLALRLIRRFSRAAIWRLRNRLLVTYIFIGVVPVLLIAALGAVSLDVLASQIAVYLATTQLQHRVDDMQNILGAIAKTEPSLRQEVMRRVAEINRDAYPRLVLFLQSGVNVARWPADSTLAPPPAAWSKTSGVALLDDRFYAWANLTVDNQHLTAAVPLGHRFLSNMLPGLGEIRLLRPTAGPDNNTRAPDKGISRSSHFDLRPQEVAGEPSAMPPKANRFDIRMGWLSSMPVSLWSSRGKTQTALLWVQTRFSALLRILFSRTTDELDGLLAYVLLGVAIAFLLVELVALFIGVSLTRTVTTAVHSLYEGTQRVTQGDFSHRIQVEGRDQLSDLSRSFNSMTENLERLVIVAKEKERLQAEIEIAREVQDQLYPRSSPVSQSLRLIGLCQPARMVSGDYYDYQRTNDSTLAVAMGDVAGKGISAALLMASIQSALRMEIRSSVAMAAPSSRPQPSARLSTATVVSELNQQLYANTAPEKFATLFFSLFDESTSLLRYTNAGHLPPLLFRKGKAQTLDVNGVIVGAFPSRSFSESEILLEPGDLLVCYTDGITEPENEYGEMYGEERLIELVSKHIDRDENHIMQSILDAVQQWTRAPEAQDDMTLLLARKQ